MAQTGAIQPAANSDTATHSSPAAIGPNDRKWLEEALSGTLGGSDPVKRIIALIQLLKKPQVDLSEALSGLEELTELTEVIDYSNDFQKVGGFPVLKSLLKNPDGDIRTKSAGLFAQLMQNNPYCQEKALEDPDLLPEMLRIMEKDEDTETRTAALLFISALVRSHEVAQIALYKMNGFSILLNSMIESTSDKFQTRAAFMLSCICSQSHNKEFAEQLRNMGIAQHFTALLRQDHRQYHEQIMEALEVVLKGSEVARKEAQQGLNLIPFLNQRREEISGREDFQDEYDTAGRILEMLNDGSSNDTPSQDR